jgi:hypothetical protein
MPLSQRPIDALHTRSDELRQMAWTASTESVQATLLRLAARFEALADGRAAIEKPQAKG